MTPVGQFVKFSQLRARTDRDLLVLLGREVRTIKETGNCGDRVKRLQLAKSLLDVVEAQNAETRYLAEELDALLFRREAVGAGC
jgi:hypothetical protein